MDKHKQQILSPGLYIVSTPIGNMEDITFRALNILQKSDIILCEDTRRSGKLLSHFEIKNKLIPYHKFNEKKIVDKVIHQIKDEKIISLISDAGTPTISDPGLVLVKKCFEENLNIYPIPGASAVTSAVSVCGFSDQYLFYGFLTKKENELNKVLNNLKNINYTIVFFIPAVKINFYLAKFKTFFSDRQILIAKEMTKIYENFIRSEVGLIGIQPEGQKGEFTVVLSEKNKDKINTKEIRESVKMEIKKMIKKYSNKDVVEFISKKEDLPKKIIYDFCLRIKKKK
jgi:16S rRNA (cytidine1402-2'-O)-methyltransferase